MNKKYYATLLNILILQFLVMLSGCASHRISTKTFINDKRILVAKTNTVGNCVAIAFSRAANTVFTGRSFKSKNDALDVAVHECINSDCRAFFATNADGCVSFAQNDDEFRRYGKGVGESAEEAETIALKYCNASKVLDSCYPVVTICPLF